MLTVSLLVLSGCGDPLSLVAPESVLYRLNPAIAGQTIDAGLDLQLVVEEPASEAALDSSRIAIVTGDARLDYIANTAWTDRAPRLVHLALVRAVERSEGFAGVGRNGGDVRADLVLKAMLSDFQARYADDGFNGAPDIEIGLDVKLVRMPGRIVVADRRFVAGGPARGSDVPAIIAAFENGLGQIAVEIARWSHEAAAAGAE